MLGREELAVIASVPEIVGAEAALSPWQIDLDPSGLIRLGGREVHPVVARDIWLRLGALLSAADRAADHDEWARLGRELDDRFARAVPARARTLQRPSQVVEGLLLRETATRTYIRLAPFALAALTPRSGTSGATLPAWEGIAYALRPTLLGHEQRPLGFRVRVAGELVAAVPCIAEQRTLLKLVDHATPATTLRSRPVPVSPPVPPAGLMAARKRVEQEHRAILQALPEGETRSVDQLHATTDIGRERLRRHLATLVELGVLATVKGERAWRRVKPRPRARARLPESLRAELLAGLAPVPSSRSTRPATSKRTRLPKPVAVPSLPFASCTNCNTAARTLSATCPRCGAAYR